jgi:quercetin dioxygenase-like cupin family protein
MNIVNSLGQPTGRRDRRHNRGGVGNWPAERPAGTLTRKASEDRMHSLTRLFLGVALSATMFTSAIAADLNPAAVTYTLPDKIEWKQGSGRNQQAILAGDPSKPGLYVVMVKWLPGGMSRPHFHPNDRFITVLKGTWWVGTGTKFDPDNTVPMPAGTFVTHFGKQVHYDGAKDEETVLLITGEGPATSTPAEEK